MWAGSSGTCSLAIERLPEVEAAPRSQYDECVNQAEPSEKCRQYREAGCERDSDLYHYGEWSEYTDILSRACPAAVKRSVGFLGGRSYFREANQALQSHYRDAAWTVIAGQGPGKATGSILKLAAKSSQRVIARLASGAGPAFLAPVTAGATAIDYAVC